MLSTESAAALVEGVAAKAMHKVEIVAECLVESVHRVVGEVVEVAERDLHNLIESGRGKPAAADAVVGVPVKADAPAEDPAPALEPAASGEAPAAPAANEPPAAQ